MADEEGPSEAAQAFQELRAEVTLMRRAVERLTAKGGPLDQLVKLSETLTSVAPNIERMSISIDILQDYVEILSAAVHPLGELVGRLPSRWLKSGKQSVHELH